MFYSSQNVTIKNVWWFSSAFINVDFVEHLNRNFPDKYSFYDHSGYGRAISLYSLVSLKNQGDLLDFTLTNIRSVKPSHIKKRNEMIYHNLQDIILNLASKTRKHATKILHGDTTCFQVVKTLAKSELE